MTLVHCIDLYETVQARVTCGGMALSAERVKRLRLGSAVDRAECLRIPWLCRAGKLNVVPRPVAKTVATVAMPRLELDALGNPICRQPPSRLGDVWVQSKRG
jgi:hypothetical protein